jgi:hypothetical protein
MLIRDPEHAAESITPWGTWARETLEPNSTLRLQSSRRWADDGSLTGGDLDGADLDYCDGPKPTRTCTSLADISRGFGRLDDGSLYAWNDHALSIRVPTRIVTAELTLDCPDREPALVVITLKAQSDQDALDARPPPGARRPSRRPCRWTTSSAPASAATPAGVSGS